jgi:hypothetical protein
MSRVLLLSSLVLSACVVQPLDEASRDEASLGAAPPAGAISVIAGAQWFERVGCPSPDPATCWTQGHFWVDLAIRNDAYDKRVGVVWIDTVREDEDGPWHTTYAAYEQALDAPYERWGVDVATRVFGGIEPKPRIRFAAFVEMGGVTSWDNNGGADHILAP